MAKIKVNVIEKKDNKLTVELLNFTTVQMNTLRRSMLTLVPTMAIEDVELKKNSSILYDEVVAHRLGLVPLKTDLGSYILPTAEEDESGDYTARSSVKLTLKVKGPKTVYASDLKSKDPKVVPVLPKIQIVRLADGQELELVATAVLGTGKKHSKWTPGLFWYTYKPIIKVNQKSKKLEEFKDQYPAVIFDKNGKIDESKLQIPSILDACEDICEDIIKVDYDENSFILYIESWGQLDPKEILEQAVVVFDSKLTTFEKEFKNL